MRYLTDEERDLVSGGTTYQEVWGDDLPITELPPVEVTAPRDPSFFDSVLDQFSKGSFWTAVGMIGAGLMALGAAPVTGLVAVGFVAVVAAADAIAITQG